MRSLHIVSARIAEAPSVFWFGEMAISVNRKTPRGNFSENCATVDWHACPLSDSQNLRKYSDCLSDEAEIVSRDRQTDR